MKTLLIASLFISAGLQAQTLDLAGFKNLLTSRQSQLETINTGMSRKIVTASSIIVDNDECNFTQTQVQSVLKIEDKKLIVLSQEMFSPDSSEACKTSGYKAFSEIIVFYENKPSLSEDLADLDSSAADIQNIVKAGDIVTMMINGKIEQDGNTTTELVTVKYDLTKSSFRNLVSTASEGSSITTSDAPDIDLGKVDLKNVLFCESSSSPKEECMQGDFSDILF